MEEHIKTILETYFEKDTLDNKELFNQLLFYIYAINNTTSDIYMLAQLLPDEYLTKLIFYFDGDTIKLPSKKEYKILLLTALCFWLKEFKNLSWNEIKQIIDFDILEKSIEISTISLGNKIIKLKKQMGEHLYKQLQNQNIENIIELVQDKVKQV